MKLFIPAPAARVMSDALWSLSRHRRQLCQHLKIHSSASACEDFRYFPAMPIEQMITSGLLEETTTP